MRKDINRIQEVQNNHTCIYNTRTDFNKLYCDIGFHPALYCVKRSLYVHVIEELIFYVTKLSSTDSTEFELS